MSDLAAQVRRNSMDHVRRASDKSLINGLDEKEQKKLQELANEHEKREHDKEERTRRSMEKLQAMSLTPSVRTIYTDALDGFTVGIDENANAEFKLQQVLTRAKESGLTLEQIFRYFSMDGDTEMISGKDFIKGLRKLHSERFKMSDEEMIELVVLFDADGDGHISMPEFLNYTLSIPAVCWRAERQRRSSVIDTSKNDVGLEDKLNIIAPAAVTRRGTYGTLEKSVEFPLMWTGSKLMWRTNETLILRMYWSHQIPPCIAILAANDDTDEEYSTIYIDPRKIPKDKSFMDSLRKEKEDSGNVGPDEDIELLVLTDFYAQYLMRRIAFTPVDENGVRNIVLTKLSADGDLDIICEKPRILKEPAKIQKEKRATFEDFQEVESEFKEISHELHDFSLTAAENEKIMEITLTMLEKMAEMNKQKSGLGKLKLLLGRHLFKKDVGEVKKVLIRSPIFQTFQKETAEKRKSLGLPDV